MLNPHCHFITINMVYGDKTHTRIILLIFKKRTLHIKLQNNKVYYVYLGVDFHGILSHFAIKSIIFITSEAPLGNRFQPEDSLIKNWFLLVLEPGGRLNIKMPFYKYKDSHVKDKTVLPTVLSLTWESHTWERRSLYWDGGLVCMVVQPLEYVLCNIAIEYDNNNSNNNNIDMMIITIIMSLLIITIITMMIMIIMIPLLVIIMMMITLMMMISWWL